MKESEVKKIAGALAERGDILRLADTLEKGVGENYTLMLGSTCVGRFIASRAIVHVLRATADMITDELRAAGIEGE